jgi:hypothetical protein
MSEPPRQRRANAWAWAYLALFGSDGDREETVDDSGQARGTSDTDDRQPPEE